MPCGLHFDRLADFVERRLPPAEGDEVQAHLDARCAHCAATVAWLAKVLDLMATDGSREPPAAVVERALHIFSESPATPSLRERIVALLTFDSYQAPAAGGARHAGGTGRQLVYRAANIDIDLHVYPQGHSEVGLLGQLLPREADDEVVDEIAGAGIVLAHPGLALTSATAGAADEIGEFVLSHIPPGRYDLHVVLSRRDIVVEGLDLAV